MDGQRGLLLLLLCMLGDAALSVRNCILARHQCADDASCRSVLEIIPKVCGPENVACSTVTVNKCLAALRTIQGFPYFQPTCLCREPHLDRECNVFREFLFDHPCIFVEKTDQSTYPVHALPLCEYALNACQQLPGCFQLYEQFREDCRVRDDQCKMEDANKCLSSWTKLKTLPMFGCICPTDQQKRKCQKIYRIIHKNPCVNTPPSAPYPPGQAGLGVWGFLFPPLPSPRPTLRQPHHSHHHPHHHNVPHAVTAFPPSPFYSSQTHNVLRVDTPATTTSPGNSKIFPVSVIPHANATASHDHRHTSSTQIQSPLLEGGAERGADRHDGSRVDGLLGGSPRHPTNPDASMTGEASGPVPVLHSTCQTVLQECLAHNGCKRLLDPVLATCDNTVCAREECMSHLQTFYRNVDYEWGHEVALCLCKKSSRSAKECLAAQEKLHPQCARRPAGPTPMMCNRLAATCKKDNSCRHRLEFYEQACAVDSDTKRCAGSTGECRRALVGILGTRLRNTCLCQANDPREQYECVDWQRILWYNPCVWEAQTDYHRGMIAALGPDEGVTTSTSIMFSPFTTTAFNSKPVQSSENLPVGTQQVVIYPPSPITSTSTSTTTDSTTSTTTGTTTTTLPPKYCEKRHDNSDIDHIAEGGGRRYYKTNEECSVLCLCHADEKLACSVLDCIEPRPCETAYAVFTHAAPAYQAARGECFCYSGSFICVRPPPDEFVVDYGVYLFLGYSKAEETLLKPYAKTSLVDAALVKLSMMVYQRGVALNKTECKLDMVSHIGENIILQVTLDEFDYTRDNMSVIMLNKEKEECEESVMEVKGMINRNDPEIRGDMALSVLILAEVQVHVPPLPASASLASCPPLVLLASLAVAVTVNRVLLAS